MSTPWVDNPLLDWLLKHLLLEHRAEPDDFEGDDWTYIRGFHDGLHSHRGVTYEHDGYDKAKQAYRDWLQETLTTPATEGGEDA